MTESKNWVTIKIPEEVRNRAQDDERTYEEIMCEGLSSLHSSGKSNNSLEERMREMERKVELLMSSLDVGYVQNADSTYRP